MGKNHRAPFKPGENDLRTHAASWTLSASDAMRVLMAARPP